MSSFETKLFQKSWEFLNSKIKSNSSGIYTGKPNTVVKNLSMDIQKNEITVLLGHNGAGKTTTMSMISGIISKTSGTIMVNGEENVDKYRHHIGYCPQHNVFLAYFTCLDHLLFFGGVS